MPSAADREAVQAQHPKVMIYIPLGPLQYRPFANKGDQQLHHVLELEGYLIDAFEHPDHLNGQPC